MVFEAHNDAEREKAKMAKAQAWYTAYLGRIDDFPSLAELLGDDREPEPQSPEIMMHNLRLWQAVLDRASGNTGLADETSAMSEHS